jgi:hypothetical protein
VHIHHVDPTDPASIDQQLLALQDSLTEPDPEECVLCYLTRVLPLFGCDTTLRWTRRWRDRVRPQATALERRFEASGGFCDCEIFWNGWTLRDDLLVVDRRGDRDWPDELPRCAGLAPRAARPCANWRRRVRGE